MRWRGETRGAMSPCPDPGEKITLRITWEGSHAKAKRQASYCTIMATMNPPMATVIKILTVQTYVLLLTLLLLSWVACVGSQALRASSLL